MNYLYKIAEFFATVCYIGKIKVAPGTFGSLVAFPLCYIIMDFTLKNQLVFQISGFNESEQHFLSLFYIEILATLLVFAIGTYFTSIYIKNMKEQDPREVVIDEVAGQMLTKKSVKCTLILFFYSCYHSFYLEYLIYSNLGQ